MIPTKTLSKSEIDFLDVERLKPKIIKKYKYVEECYPFEGIMVPIFLFGGGLCLFKEFYFVGIMAIICGILFGALTLKLVMECCSFRIKKRNAKKYGKKFVGTIKAYNIHAFEHYITAGAGARTREIELNYILEIEIEQKGRKRIIQTPWLKYNPASTLKSNQCMVYQYENEYYALDFNLRRRRKDETAKIPRKKINIGYIGRPKW